MTQPLVTPDLTDSGSEDGLYHLVCECDEDLALCGTDVQTAVWAPRGDDDNCVVCFEMQGRPCERCGG